jgi:hypothetical protein
MKTQVMKLFGLALMVGMVVMSGVGCSSAPQVGVYQINVTTDESLKGSGANMPQVEVDLVGLNDAQLQQQWHDYKPENYFSGNDVLRSTSREFTKSFVFTEDKPTTKTLEKKDPMCVTWKSQERRTLMVLVNSKAFKSSSGGTVQRKIELPLTTDRWNGDVIDLVVKSSGVELKTGMKGK